jgi:hypothetical protein
VETSSNPRSERPFANEIRPDFSETLRMARRIKKALILAARKGPSYEPPTKECLRQRNSENPTRWIPFGN